MVIFNPLGYSLDDILPWKAAEIAQGEFCITRIEGLEAPVVRLEVNDLLLAYSFPSAPVLSADSSRSTAKPCSSLT